MTEPREDHELVDRIRLELFSNLAHYRQHCISEREDAVTVANFINALRRPSPVAESTPANATAVGEERLTKRESEVAGLVAEWLTNKQIARRLGISERTVEVHVANVKSKLGVTTRRAVARVLETTPTDATAVEAERVNCFGIPDTYRGWSIEQGPDDQFYGTGPNYDASYEGPEDGWVDNGERCCAPTWPGLREEIDIYIEEYGG